MDIIKCFVLSDAQHEVRMVQEGDDVLFRADDMGSVLQTKNIHTSIAMFEDSQKALRTMYTPHY